MAHKVAVPARALGDRVWEHGHAARLVEAVDAGVVEAEDSPEDCKKVRKGGAE